MDALMIYHTAICQDAHRSHRSDGLMKRVRQISAVERGLRRSIRFLVAPFGSDVARPGSGDGTAIK